MHDAAKVFLTTMRAAHPGAFKGRVLECGSMEVNGSPRSLFDAVEYVGIDWRPGKGVDVVSLVHEYGGKPDGYFDTVISTEMLEHDAHWRRSVARMGTLVRRGGNLIITCAGPHRECHSAESASEGGWYENRTLADIVSCMPRFRIVQGEDDPEACDVRLLAMGKL